MIVPTTILSLAALSAAESNSSGNRGLRKSSTPWTAIAVVTGTAVTAGVVGGVIGWFSHSATVGASGSCSILAAAGIRGTCSGCDKDYLLIASETCNTCADGKPLKANKGGKNFGDLDGTAGKPWEAPADCEANGCRADFHQKITANTCVACPEGQYILASTTSITALQATCTGCKAGYFQAGTTPAEGCTKCAGTTTIAQTAFGSAATVCA